MSSGHNISDNLTQPMFAPPCPVTPSNALSLLQELSINSTLLDTEVKQLLVDDVKEYLEVFTCDSCASMSSKFHVYCDQKVFKFSTRDCINTLSLLNLLYVIHEVDMVSRTNFQDTVSYVNTLPIWDDYAPGDGVIGLDLVLPNSSPVYDTYGDEDDLVDTDYDARGHIDTGHAKELQTTSCGTCSC